MVTPVTSARVVIDDALDVLEALGSAATSPWLLGGVFIGAMILSFASSQVLVADIDRVGRRLAVPEALLGLIAALGADSPEISSALAALLSGRHDLGLGVVLGSNIFNLAALLGMSAVVTGGVTIGQPTLLLNGGVAVAVTAIAIGLLFGVLTPVVSVALIALVFVPYVALLALRAPQIEQLGLPEPVTRFATAAVAEARAEARGGMGSQLGTLADALSIVPSLFTIIVSSILIVRTAGALGDAWGIPHAIVGSLVLATVTGVPNVVAALHLARQGRGAAVVSESLNSNTLNLLAGVYLPALVIGLLAPSRQATLAAWWLLGMTLLAVILTGRRGGLSRVEGGALLVLYAAFVGLIIIRR